MNGLEGRFGAKRSMDGMLRCLTELTSGRTHLNVYVLDAPVLIMSALCVRAK